MFEVAQAVAVVKLTALKKMMAEIKQTLESWETKGMVSFKDRPPLMAVILPRSRWAVSIMYAALADAKRGTDRGQADGVAKGVVLGLETRPRMI